MENNRSTFGSTFGFLMAAVGSAVGLGNIWGFPYKMGKNGGFAFLLIYLILAIFVGLAVMLGEFAIGRKTGKSPVAAYRQLSKKFTWLGYLAIIAPFLILCFYFVLGGMVTRYALTYLLAIFGWNTWGVEDIATYFGVFTTNGGEMILWTAIFIACNAYVVAAGVEGGIEKFCKIGMPALFVMLLIVIIYVACQPGAGGGYQFMFGWNLEPLQKEGGFLQVLSTAAGQMFFSLSLGMGAMLNYGSYLKKEENLQKNAVIVVVCDTIVAIMAGMVVMPACYAFLDGNTTSGPGLLFRSMQIVFDKMGYIGNIMGFLFYSLVFIAAISSSMSLLEVITSYKIDQNVEQGKAPGRKKYAIIAAVIIFIFSLPVCLDGIGAGTPDASIGTPAQILGITHKEVSIDQAKFDKSFEMGKDGTTPVGPTYFTKDADGAYTAVEAGTEYDASATYYVNNVKGWDDCWLDFYDVISEGILMPISAMVMAFAIGWIWKLDMVVEEAEQSGHKFWGHGFFNLCYKFITPIGMLIVLYGQIVSFFG